MAEKIIDPRVSRGVVDWLVDSYKFNDGQEVESNLQNVNQLKFLGRVNIEWDDTRLRVYSEKLGDIVTFVPESSLENNLTKLDYLVKILRSKDLYLAFFRYDKKDNQVFGELYRRAR